MKQEVLHSVLEELKTLFLDIKAESIVLELEKKNISRKDIFTENKSTFTRTYRRDVIKYKKNPDADKLFLELSRNGIYDNLPEAFFHKNTKIENASYATARQRKKKEEKNSRLFFSPIENEIFNQKINIEKTEIALIDEFYSSDNDFLLNFWNLNSYKHNPYVIKLIKLLPHCNKIAGDFELTKLSLEKILEEKVTFKKNFESVGLKTKESSNHVLGIDFTTVSKTFAILQPFVKFTIGPVSKEKLNFYHRNKDLTDFLALFYSYFLPLEIEAKTQFLCERDEKFILNDTEEPIMGISTII